MQSVKRHIKPGQVYRRADLEFYSTAVDRHLSQLTNAGVLRKIGQGLYYAPKESKFGFVPPDDKELVTSFLKDGNFLLLSPNIFNSLGLGITQLYNVTWVYNHKRRGEFKLNGKIFFFKVKSSFPLNLTREYLLIELLNNLHELAENSEQLLTSFDNLISEYDFDQLMIMTQQYGSGFTKKFMKKALRKLQLKYA